MTGNSAGTATITATCGNHSASCSVLVQQSYGNIAGDITYYYNSSKGNVADASADVILIPADGSAKSLKNVSDPFSALLNPSVFNEYGIYATRAGSTGSYTINNVPTGKYIVYIRSGNAISSAWYGDHEGYYATIANALSPYLDESVAIAFGETNTLFKYTIKEVTIMKDKTTTLSYNF